MSCGEKVWLVCSIVDIGERSITYVVRDENGEEVASGGSSNLDWVKHDAGGYHTASNFDARYGAGNWSVAFDWEVLAHP